MSRTLETTTLSTVMTSREESTPSTQWLTLKVVFKSSSSKSFSTPLDQSSPNTLKMSHMTLPLQLNPLAQDLATPHLTLRLPPLSPKPVIHNHMLITPTDISLPLSSNISTTPFTHRCWETHAFQLLKRPATLNKFKSSTKSTVGFQASTDCHFEQLFILNLWSKFKNTFVSHNYVFIIIFHSFN